MPWSGATKFVGRENELELLHQFLQGNHQVAIAAIAGMGGVGKTELALQYALKQRQFYSGGICWCGVKIGNVGLQVVQFARIHLELNPLTDLDLVGQVAYCWQRWCEGKVLLVLDDVIKYKEIQPYLPPSSTRFKVLMTTRSHFGQIQKLSLDVLQPQAALELLRKLIGDERANLETSYFASLAERLGYLPLGLELVGRYLARKEDLSIAKMLQRLEKKGLKERSLSQLEDDMTADKSVEAAFELSWDELNDTDKQLACLLSLFGAAPIPWELVKQCLPNADAEELEESRDEKLVNLHLLQRKSKGIYQLHRLLREFFQAKLEAPPLQESGGNFKQAFVKVIIAIAKYIPPTPTLKEITTFSPAMPHLAEVAKNFIEYISDEDLIWAFVGNGRFYKGQGLYAQAEPWFKQCLEVSKKRLGDNHPYVAQSLNNLAGVYKCQGRYDEAEPLYQQALEVMRHLRGEEHPYLAPILNNLAELYRSQGRYNQAEPLYQQALQLRRHLLGKEYPAVAESLNNLALLYYYQGRYSEAEPLALRAIELDKQFLKEKHPDLATDIHNLALIYRAQGRYSEAEPLFLEALKLKQLLLPEDHPLLADTIYALGYMYRIQGCYTKAEEFSIKALELDKRLLGDNHPYVAQSLNNLVELYKSQGSYSQAKPLLQEALDIFERQLGVNHPHTITVRENLAILQTEITFEE
ncbi:tetratricopeptide repeat protein [Scytonema hofmannii FACHB-248]|uniref:Tetratricopeptide repeat protein n=1 Tax=Scytonema hofmannii FACHB-248 TaxID=1842502 RepID=A0ABR8GZ11_9CYAN|nr:tetratricopeptide repeat protein [Scytonema hofmannii FACHB-248]